MKQLQDQLFNKIENLYPEMVEIRRYMHQHPELSFQEVNTAKFIQSYYEKLGIEVRGNVGGNGVVAKIHGTKPDRKSVVLGNSVFVGGGRII